MKRTIAWLRRNRRTAKDYERMVQPSEILLEVATVRVLLGRLPREP